MSVIEKHILNSYEESLNIIQNFIKNRKNIDLTKQIGEKISEIFKNGNKIIICGNGGSACDAMHFAEEFTGRYRKNRKALPVISLTDSSHITCVGNDYGFEYIFSRGVEAYCKKGDMVIGISTSGNSENVIKAIEKAKTLDAYTFSPLGKDGGKIKGMCDYEFIIPGETSDRIQELHMIILHIIIESVERILFPDLY